MTTTALSGSQFREYRGLIDHFRKTLRSAAAERPFRRGTVTTDDGIEMEWVLHERQVMLDAVNTQRRQRGLSPVPLAHVVRAESSACGHVDYAVKFAIGCADLVFSDDSLER